MERPRGIATAKHALKPPLVSSHRDQRYYPTIIRVRTDIERGNRLLSAAACRFDSRTRVMDIARI